ncbi:hypothetical protein [Methanosarcina mazei]|nr:hypothetical protein [Methanosarcina mazei]MDO5840296.1 hypothetical protein [Methanosarcina mazei]
MRNTQFCELGYSMDYMNTPYLTDNRFINYETIVRKNNPEKYA